MSTGDVTELGLGSLDVREWAVGAIQDQFKLDATSAEPFEMPDCETASFDATRMAVLELGKRMSRSPWNFVAAAQV